MASIKIIISNVLLLTALLSSMAIVQVNSKSLSCANNPLIPMDTLYPSTSTLAIHPMDAYPLTGGAGQVATPVCPTGPLRANGDSALSKRQLCPVDFVTNYDQDRIPAIYQEARCLCSGCLDPMTGQESSLYRCEEVKYPVAVLRKRSSCSQGLQMYELTHEDVTVGCACSQFFL
ncbi:interleukin-17D-like [Asterias amurensis]|uniref:interleukin-17D-like n=1 Tax=Asterias amurensis TaxID=7602 RepID=UPI003AB89D37